MSAATAPASQPRRRGKSPAERTLRLVATPARRARRAPFVALVLLLLGLGLVGLLVLNTSLQEGAFGLAELDRQTTLLRDRRAALDSEVARLAEPASLSRRAAALGMVPVDRPEYLRLGEPGHHDR